MFKVNNAWSAIGGSLALIALYLVLERAGNFSKIIAAGKDFFTSGAKVLQGR